MRLYWPEPILEDDGKPLPEHFMIDQTDGNVYEVREASNHEALHLIVAGWTLVDEA